MGVLAGRRGAGCLAPIFIAGILLAAETGEFPPDAAHSEDEIESAMLYNFTKFVEWPDGALGGAGAPVVVGVLGDDRLVPVLTAELSNRTIYGHPIAIRRLGSSAGLKTCAVILVGATGRKEIARMVQSVGRWPVLTIGERAQFSRLGGVIAFIPYGNRIRFEVNLDAAERAGLRVSSKLLRLAAVWRETPPLARN